MKPFVVTLAGSLAVAFLFCTTAVASDVNLAVVAKPFSPRELLKTVQTILEERTAPV